MLEKFKNFIQSNELVSPSDSILVGVSGGMDSIFLITLLQRLNFNFGIAHCNFQLRGADSDLDESFVREIASKMEKPYYSIVFETKNIAKERKTSIQIAARDLRYEWFEKIRVENGYQYIATAHHINDSMETVLYNLAKGCGIRGLHGILPKTNQLIRPILCFSRAEINRFITEQNITFREDKSNNSIKYNRNYIRHEIVPRFKHINPNFDNTSQLFIEKMKDTEALMDFAIQTIQPKIVSENSQKYQIDIEKLLQYPSPKTVLFELLKPYQFNASQIHQILAQRNNPSGKIFISTTGIKGVLDRKTFIIQKESKSRSAISIDTIGHYEFDDFSLSIETIERPKSLKTDSNTIILDKKHLIFPLIIRSWKPGDSFQPFGMHGQSQKLQDFFSNEKLSLLDKENVKILESNQKILWVMGYRMADWCKIKSDTTDFVKITFSIQ